MSRFLSCAFWCHFLDCIFLVLEWHCSCLQPMVWKCMEYDLRQMSWNSQRDKLKDTSREYFCLESAAFVSACWLLTVLVHVGHFNLRDGQTNASHQNGTHQVDPMTCKFYEMVPVETLANMPNFGMPASSRIRSKRWKTFPCILPGGCFFVLSKET